MQPCGLGDFWFISLINETLVCESLEHAEMKCAADTCSVKSPGWMIGCSVMMFLHYFTCGWPLKEAIASSPPRHEFPFLLPPCGHMAISVAFRTLLRSQSFLCKTLLKYTLKMWCLPLPTLFLASPYVPISFVPRTDGDNDFYPPYPNCSCACSTALPFLCELVSVQSSSLVCMSSVKCWFKSRSCVVIHDLGIDLGNSGLVFQEKQTQLFVCLLLFFFFLMWNLHRIHSFSRGGRWKDQLHTWNLDNST